MPPTETFVAGVVIVVLVQLSTLAVNIWKFRRSPPIAEEIYRDFATKTELAALRAEFNSTFGEIFSVLRSLRDQISNTTERLTGQINRLDGILSRCPGPAQCAKENPR